MPLLSNYSSRPGIVGGAAGPLGDDGKLPTDQLPATGLTARVTVANQAARYALTIADVQNGDYVRQTDTGILYEVTDETQLAPGVTPANAFTGLATVTAAQISDSGAAGRAVVQGSTAAGIRGTLELTAAATGDASGLSSGTLPAARLPGTLTAATTLSANVAATSTSTGTLIISGSGGVGIGGALFVGGSASVAGMFTAGAGVTEAFVVITAPTTITTSHRNIVMNPSAAFTQPLPALAGGGGRVYDFKNKGLFTVTLQGNGAELIDDFNTFEVSPGSSATVINDLTRWLVK